MKTVLLYLLMSFSGPVMAQQAAGEDEPTEPDTEQSIEVVQIDEDESVQDEDESEIEEPSDIDFKPDEEISEDYPVPLPSDI